MIRPRTLPLLPLLLPALLFAQTPPLAPNPGPPPTTQPGDPAAAPVTTLSVRTRLVEISAVVLSKSGQPAGGLTRDDFILKEDGHDQPIHYFSQGSDLPLTLALLVDTSGSQRTFINDESLASDVFFESMLTEPRDRAMLVQFDTRILQLRPLTASPDQLHLALSRLGPDPSPRGGTLLQDAVAAVSKGPLARETGRKAIVILSDGGDNGSQTSLAAAIEQAQRANIQIFSVRYSAWEGFAGGTGGMPGAPHGADPGMSILQKLSDATGGRVFNVTRAEPLRAIFADIASDLRLEYELGYTPPPDLVPNSYHRLEVRTRDRKLNVQARKGFFAQP